MRWQLQSFTVLVGGFWLIGLARYIDTHWPNPSLVDFLIASGIFLMMLGVLHLCLNTIVESLRK